MDNVIGLLIVFVTIVLSCASLYVVWRIARAMNEGRLDRREGDGWKMSSLGALICLVAAMGTGIYSVVFLLNSAPATATIVDVVVSETDEGEERRSVVYTYEVEGEQYQDRTSSSYGREFFKGDEIPVRYHLTRRHESRIDYWSYHWGLSVLMLGAAFVFAVFALILRSGQAKQPPAECVAVPSNST